MSGLATERERAEEARKMLEWGIRAFERKTLFAKDETIGELSVYGGANERCGQGAWRGRHLAADHQSGPAHARITYRWPLRAPIEKGAGRGSQGLYRRSAFAGDAALSLPRPSDKGPLHSQALDAFIELAQFWRNAIRQAFKSILNCSMHRGEPDNRSFSARVPWRVVCRVWRPGFEHVTNQQGRFITFEGGEGVGKSTQIHRLANVLRRRGHDVLVTREPGGSLGAEAVRHVLLSGAAEEFGVRMEAMLFAAARSDHIEEVIRPAVPEGAIVLCDRFMDSSRVYQGVTGNLEPRFIQSWNA
jgi:hypothetical protein